MSITVIDRHGAPRPLQMEAIAVHLQSLASMLPALTVGTDTIATKAVASLVDGIHTQDIDGICAGICASMIIEDCEYDDLAARILVCDLHKRTSASIVQYVVDLETYEYRDQRIQILHPKLAAFCRRYAARLDAAIDYQRDYANSYFGLMTMMQSYLLAHRFDDDVRVVKERPQQMLLRVAIGINLNAIAADGAADEATISNVLSTYDLLSRKYYTHATPTLFNAGTVSGTLSSCYLLEVDDSLTNIYSRLTDIAKISKFSGGVGIHVSQVRAAGSVISSTVGRSEGLLPMLRVFNESTRYVSQGGGKRKGSTAVYVEPWHADVESLILSQRQQGAPEMLCRDLFLALWVPDIFMRRLRDALKTQRPVQWSLMCPHECPGLTDAYGEAFDDLYGAYEAAGRYRSQIDIRKLWELIVATQIETGRPYLMYKDHVNRKCNQNNLGVIKSSNLCVAGDTKILTYTGYVEIKKLAGHSVPVWNGAEWSDAMVMQTNRDQVLYRVRMSDGARLDCTAEHRFNIRRDGEWDNIPTRDLRAGDVSRSVEHMPRINAPYYRRESSNPYGPPHDMNIFIRLKWLSDHLDVDAACMQITSQDVAWLRDVQLLAHTLGTTPFIAVSPRGHHLRFSKQDADVLINQLEMPTRRLLSDYYFTDTPPLTVVSVERLPGTHDTYCFNEPRRHMGVFGGVYTHNCSEILLYSDAENIGVCNLASVCLPKFVSGGTFDYKQLCDVVQLVVINMNRVIDNNQYQLQQARHADMRSRPIGIGVQGLSEVFMMMGVAFDSEQAMECNRLIFETMYFAALRASNRLAQIHGAYETFPTSMTARGQLQFDLWGVQPSDMWDWKSLRADVVKSGLRNSLLLALMPVAGTSIVQGMTTEGVEPLQSNVFTRSTLSGRFQVVNRHLVAALKKRGLWKRSIRNAIIANDGSVQGIQEIPPEIQAVYKTVYEYKITSLIKMEAQRACYICQSTSSNRYLPQPDMSLLTNAHLFAWKLGLKTSSYYTKIKQQNVGYKLLDREDECLSCQA